jgi:hypothetical protein
MMFLENVVMVANFRQLLWYMHYHGQNSLSNPGESTQDGNDDQDVGDYSCCNNGAVLLGAVS